MLKVKGVMVYPAAIDSVINRFVPKVTGEFRIVLDEPPPRVVPPLKIRVERAKETPQSALEALGAEIEERMHSALKIRPKILWVEPNTFERAVHKTKFFEKAYEKK